MTKFKTQKTEFAGNDIQSLAMLLQKNFRSTREDLDAIDKSISGMVPGGLRQTVLQGGVDSNGDPNYLSIGTGLSVNGAASASNPVVFIWSNGFTSSPYDLISVVEANFVFNSLTAYSSPYLYAENDGDGAITYGSNNYIPIWSKVYQGYKAGAIYASFEGTNGATAFTDSYNNAWTLANGAALSNAQKKLNATTSLYFGGTNDNAYVQAPSFAGKWTMECWFRASGHGALQVIMGSGINSGSYGGAVLAYTTGQKLSLYLSSNNSSWDIANGTAGSTTLSDNTWYHVALVFDGSTYKVYCGASGTNTQEISVTSSTAIYQSCAYIMLGANGTGTSNPLTGYIEAFRFSPFARYTAAFTVPSTAFTPDDVHWFNSNKMIMYRGYHNNWTAVYRVFCGSCVTGASTVSAVTNFPLQAYGMNNYMTVGIDGFNFNGNLTVAR